VLTARSPPPPPPLAHRRHRRREREERHHQRRQHDRPVDGDVLQSRHEWINFPTTVVEERLVCQTPAFALVFSLPPGLPPPLFFVFEPCRQFSLWLVALANWTGLSDLLDSAKELFGITASTLTFSSRPLPPPALGERRHGGLAARLIPVRRPTVFVVAKYGIRSWRMKSSSGHAGRKRSNCAVAKIEELARRVANLQADAEVKALRDEVERLQAELAKRPSP